MIAALLLWRKLNQQIITGTRVDTTSDSKREASDFLFVRGSRKISWQRILYIIETTETSRETCKSARGIRGSRGANAELSSRCTRLFAVDADDRSMPVQWTFSNSISRWARVWAAPRRRTPSRRRCRSTPEVNSIWASSTARRRTTAPRASAIPVPWVAPAPRRPPVHPVAPSPLPPPPPSQPPPHQLPPPALIIRHCRLCKCPPPVSSLSKVCFISSITRSHNFFVSGYSFQFFFPRLFDRNALRGFH